MRESLHVLRTPCDRERPLVTDARPSESRGALLSFSYLLRLRQFGPQSCARRFDVGRFRERSLRTLGRRKIILRDPQRNLSVIDLLPGDETLAVKRFVICDL
jgi:hypothetical protein